MGVWKKPLRAAAVIACVAGGAPAGAAVVKTSFGVSVTVVASCRIVAGQSRTCAKPAAAGSIAPPQPVVTYSRDPKTGVAVETVAF